MAKARPFTVNRVRGAQVTESEAMQALSKSIERHFDLAARNGVSVRRDSTGIQLPHEIALAIAALIDAKLAAHPTSDAHD